MNPAVKEALSWITRITASLVFGLFYVFLVMILSSHFLHKGPGPDDGLNMMTGMVGFLTCPLPIVGAILLYPNRIWRVIIFTADVIIVGLLLYSFTR